MPLVQISLIRGKSPAHIRAIAGGVHQALVRAYGVPLDDRFQLIRQYERDELVYDGGFLGIARTDNIVFIHIVASRTRDTSTKRAFFKAVVDNLSSDPGLRPEDVLIVLSPNDREDWSFGNGLASYANADEEVCSPSRAESNHSS